MANIQNIFLIGPMGAGKTSIGRVLARELSMEFFDSDQEIEKKCGVDLAWIMDVEGPEGFRKREEQAIAELTQRKGIVLATGGGTVDNPANRALLASRGTVVYLKTTLEQQVERTSKDRRRPDLRHGNVRETLEQFSQKRTPLYEELADYALFTDERSVRAAVSEIVKKLFDRDISLEGFSDSSGVE